MTYVISHCCGLLELRAWKDDIKIEKKLKSHREFINSVQLVHLTDIYQLRVYIFQAVIIVGQGGCGLLSEINPS